MSWNITSIGPRAAVKAAVLSPSNSTMPQSLKDTIVAILDDVPNPAATGAVYPDGARLESHGHYGQGYGQIGKLELFLFFLAKEPVATS